MKCEKYQRNLVHFHEKSIFFKADMLIEVNETMSWLLPYIGWPGDGIDDGPPSMSYCDHLPIFICVSVYLCVCANFLTIILHQVSQRDVTFGYLSQRSLKIQGQVQKYFFSHDSCQNCPIEIKRQMPNYFFFLF